MTPLPIFGFFCLPVVIVIGAYGLMRTNEWVINKKAMPQPAKTKHQVLYP